MNKKFVFWATVLVFGILVSGCYRSGSGGNSGSNSGGGRNTVRSLSGTWAGEGEGAFFKFDNGKFESHFNKGTYKVSGSTITFKTTHEWSKRWIAANYEFTALIGENGNCFTLGSGIYTRK